MAGLTARDLKVTRGDETFPYSGGVCIEALQSAGVPTDDAVAAVQEVEEQVREDLAGGQVVGQRG